MTAGRRGARWPLAIAGLVTAVVSGWGLSQAHASAPPCRYVVSGSGTPNGTVYDTVTGLTWQQTVYANTYTWAAAQTACSTLSYGGFTSGWRTPGVKELMSIVDYTRRRPTVDTVAFPLTPDNLFWTSTPYGGNTESGYAWFVDFTDGSVDAYDLTDMFPVRCVR